MKKSTQTLVAVVCLLTAIAWVGLNARGSAEPTSPQKLAVVWTSGDPEIAHRVCFMYTHNAKKAGWFDEVVLVVWGPSSRLLAGDKDLQKAVRDMMKDGVTVQACQACADSYGVSPALAELGIEVKYMGGPLTEMLKTDWKILTF